MLQRTTRVLNSKSHTQISCFQFCPYVVSISSFSNSKLQIDAVQQYWRDDGTGLSGVLYGWGAMRTELQRCLALVDESFRTALRVGRISCGKNSRWLRKRMEIRKCIFRDYPLLGDAPVSAQRWVEVADGQRRH